MAAPLYVPAALGTQHSRPLETAGCGRTVPGPARPSLARVYMLSQLAHRLRLCVAWPNAFPGYFAASFDIFCSISAHARWVGLALARTTVGSFDCVRLLESRALVLGVVAAFGDDVAWR